MDLFPDGAHVWLRSRELGAYLHADEDGVGVSLTPRRASPNAAWAVHRVRLEGITYVLLHGAAYGRYLAVSPEPAPRGHRGSRAVQRDCDDFDLDPQALQWRPLRAWGDDDVLLRYDYERNLRANGRYRRWHTAVTVDDAGAARSTMMRWTVLAIPPRQPPPPDLPPPTPRNLGARRGLLRRRAGAEALPRTIWYARADADGDVNEGNWVMFQFYGRSVFDLRAEVALREGDVNSVQDFTLCVKAGNEARRTPLFVDLPRNRDPLTIVALTTGSPAAAALVYPDVDSPSPPSP